MSRVRRALAGRDGLAQIAVVLGAVGAYEAARILIKPDWPAAFANANRVVRLEQVFGLAWEDSLQRLVLAVPDAVHVLNLFYFVGHFLLTGIFFFWLHHRSRAGFRSFRDGFLVATAIAIVIHWKFPTAPPRLAGVGLQDTLLVFSGIDIGSPSTSALTNPVAAVPSLHAAYALGVGIGLVLYARSHVWRLAGALYPPLVFVTIVVTGNHFILDAVAGTAVLGVGFLVAGRLGERRRGEEAAQEPCYT
ncbi:MAG: phosphatase PAP2 family protein [Actinobacteria bacterium]|nr:phosphatase PAP2 family protein [Actinomycetota bacterium]